jgi:hypothetical protein
MQLDVDWKPKSVAGLILENSREKHKGDPSVNR